MNSFHYFVLFLFTCFFVRLYCRYFFAYQWFENSLCKWILFPFFGLQKQVTKLCDRIPILIQILLLVLISLGSGIFLVKSYFLFPDFTEYLLAIMDSTTFMSFVNILLSVGQGAFAENVGYPAMVAVAVSSFASFLYSQYTIHTVENLTGPTPTPWVSVFSGIVTILLNLLFFFMSAMMAHFLKDWYATAADAVLAYFMGVEDALHADFGNDFLSAIYAIYYLVVFAILSYATLAAFTIVLQEYLATICYGIFSMVFLMIVSMMFGNQLNEMPELLAASVLIMFMMVGDIVRSNESANKLYVRLIHFLGRRRIKKAKK